MDLNDVLINCDGRNFTKDIAICDRTMSLESILNLCEDLYYEVDELSNELQNLEEDLEENYIPKSKAEQYGINNSDFI